MPSPSFLLVVLALGASIALAPTSLLTPDEPLALDGDREVQEAARCADPGFGHAARAVPAPDLTCLALFPTPAAAGAEGTLRLLPAATPFGVAVTRDGVLRHRFVLEAADLPDPAELGPYDRFVGWLAPPTLSPMVRLGELRDGRVDAEAAGFNAYLILVSAEGPEPTPERTGPLVLRGTSPAMVLRPHDLPLVLAEMAAPPPAGDDPHAPHAHAHPAGPQLPAPHDAHGTPLADLPPGEPAWRPPPMHPEVDMPAQMMALRPGVTPFLPTGAAGGDAAEGAGSIPDAEPPRRIHLQAGDTLDLEAGPVFRRVGGLRIPGFGFNGQSPGPLIEADEGATVHVRFRNRTPLPSAIHWHGIRLDAPFDGVPGVTQAPVAPDAEFHYELRLPDEGTFWYHPHLREDVAQDMGLAGNLRVRPEGDAGAAPVDREEFLVLDDHLVGPEGPVPYGREAPTHALMGRFGNVLLANGDDAWHTSARAGDVVRFHLTNAANTRTFNLSFGGLPMKLVASDVGRMPRETWVESVVIAPAERWVVDVRFPDGGEVALENRVQALDHMNARFFPDVRRVGTVTVEEGSAEAAASGAGRGAARAAGAAFDSLRVHPALDREVRGLVRAHLGRTPDRTLVLGLRTGELPFPLDPILGWEGVYRPPVEWEGTMPDMDWLATGLDVEWVLRDAATGAENMEIGWRFRVGERVRLRIVNDRDTLHPMQHPIHLHGQRFLVLSVDGEPVAHPAWKDTVLVPVGAVVDLLLELDNPGPWMLHCHIAEHLETGMMTVIDVEG